MKIRRGFVSNSSSTSFTCDVCGYNVSGMDMGYDEAGMYSCENGHEFCREHATPWEPSWEEKKETLLGTWKVDNDDYIKHLIIAAETEERIDQIISEHDLENLLVVGEYEVPAAMCPLCSFGNIHDRDAYEYLLKVAGRTESDLLAELKEKFGSYPEMKKWLKESQS